MATTERSVDEVLNQLSSRVDGVCEQLIQLRFENMTMRKACRDTNRGIQRLRKNCDSQRRKLNRIKAAAPELWAALFPPRPRPTE